MLFEHVPLAKKMREVFELETSPSMSYQVSLSAWKASLGRRLPRSTESLQPRAGNPLVPSFSCLVDRMVADPVTAVIVLAIAPPPYT